MKKLRGITKALIWFLFTVPMAVGGTIYYLEAVAACAGANVIALLLWVSVMLLVTGLTAMLYRWTEQKPGLLNMGKSACVALEIICCIILVGAGIYFRIGREFVAFWSEQDGNPVVEAALVTLNRTVGGQTDLVTAAYVYLLNQLFFLVGNLSLAAAGMQLVLFIVGGILLYFLIRRCYGAFPAVICLGGLMLLPEMIRASMYCSPEILLFLITVILGWILHLSLDGRLNSGSKGLLDLLLLALFTAGCVYVDQPVWNDGSGEVLLNRVLTVSGQTALVLGIVCAVVFLFLESWQTAAVYMMMAVLLIAVQLLGYERNVGCMAALGVVMSILLGISLKGLLFGEPAVETAGKTEPEPVRKDEQADVETVEKTEVKPAAQEEQATVETAGKTELEPVREDEQADVETVEKTEVKPAAQEEQASVETAEKAGPEIFIPETMAIPKRKKRAKIDFDREFTEEEMNFDLEVEDGEEFDR